MEKFKLRRLAGFLILSILMFSCSNELHMTLPQGPQGSSAYDLWVEQVNNGSIKWDKNNVDLNNFFLYLKGADGKDGQNGVDGKSAYQLWVEQVKVGLDNPHNTGTNWSVDNVSMQDFWYFLTGAKGQNGSTPIIGSNGNWYIDGNDTGIPAKGKDGQDGQNGSNGSNGQNGTNGQDGSVVTIGSNGNWFIDGVDTTVPAFGKDGSNGSNGQDGQDGQDGQNGSNGQNGVNGKSAYELWVEEVAKGLDNPHIAGTLWPKDQTTTTDFWEYLRGADGKDGEDGSDGKPGESGKPGGDVIIVKGKPNVVAQYSQQEVSEYVRTTDGAVLYTVYDDQGSISPGAIVSNIPGIDSSITFTADANGQFVIPKDSLPVDLAIANRFGTCQVNYKKSTGSQVTETSANNTYVPNKMQIRIRLTSSITLDSSDENVYFVIERKADLDKDWERIPTYLGNLSQYIKAYELSDINNPSSYTQTSKKFYNGYATISTATYAYVKRLAKQSDYVLSESYPWDGNDHYFNLVLESYYGEKPNANAVIKMAPVQYMPLIKNLKAYNYSLTLNVFSKIEGEFDFGVNNGNIDQNLLFASSLTKETKTLGSNTFDYYYPTLVKLSNIQASSFNIQFSVSTNTSNNTLTSSIASPNFNVLTPYLGSSVYLSSNNIHFRGYGTMAYIKNVDGVLKVVGTKNYSYNFPDIPVQEITE